MTPGERIARANRARELLSEETMRSVFAGVKNALIEKLEMCPVGDTGTQHEIALTLQLLKQLQNHLRHFVDDGVLAEAEVQQESFMARMKRKVSA
jgi:hypothetical protein